MGAVAVEGEYRKIELWCDIGPRLLLGKQLLRGDPVKVTSENLVELACRSCRNTIAREIGRKPRFVLHRFNIVGELVESLTIW